jgi:GAF domain-containing protein
MTGDPEAVEGVLAAVALRLAAADRLAPAPDDGVLAALADVTVTALQAQAASIALHDGATDRLVFRAAAGPAAGAIVGVAIDSGVGIAGYAFTTGQPLAVADVAADPRFERTVAEATGYVPSSLLAVPIVDATATVGVLEALDGHDGRFSLRDIDLATSIAAVIALTVRRERLRHDATALLRQSLSELVSAPDDGIGDDAVEALVARATAGLASDDDPTWVLVDRLARLRDVDPDSIELAIDWLDVLARHRGARRGRAGDRS